MVNSLFMKDLTQNSGSGRVLVQPAHSWVSQQEQRVPRGAILDLACGTGRNGRLFLARGDQVTFLDRDCSALNDLADQPRANVLEFDLEQRREWPFVKEQFQGVLVINYLYRPLFNLIYEAIAPGGVLVYHTFALGNEVYGRPSNPDFLLRENELLDAFAKRMRVLAFEQGFQPNPDRVVQSLCAVKAIP